MSEIPTKVKTGKGPCPKCTSSDAYHMYSDGSTYCFSCKYYIASSGIDKDSRISKEPLIDTLASEVKSIQERRIDAKTCETYGVTTLDDGTRVYKFYDRQGVLSNLKYKKDSPKTFWNKGNLSESTLFGQSVFPPNSAPYVIITEGEDDALAAHQMLSGGPAVSIKSGASSAKKDIVDNFDYLNSFKTIYLAFDNDAPGVKATEEVARVLPSHKLRVLDLSHNTWKDPCDYNSTNEGRDTFKRLFIFAKKPVPKGIISGREAWEEAMDRPTKSTVARYPWECLNTSTRGLRFGEVVLLTAPSGVGKSYVLNEILNGVLNTTSYNIGMIGQEEDDADFSKRLMSIKLSKPIHFDDVRARVTAEEWDRAQKEIPLERCHGFFEVGSLDIDEILSTVTYMVEGLGCKFVFYDHISMTVSDQRNALDERKALDRLSTRLKALAKKLDFCCVIVSHLNREGEVRGSANPEKICDTWIDLRRELLGADDASRNLTEIVIRKNRFVGTTGPSGVLFFDLETYRLTEYIGGGNLND